MNVEQVRNSLPQDMAVPLLTLIPGTRGYWALGL